MPTPDPARGRGAARPGRAVAVLVGLLVLAALVVLLVRTGWGPLPDPKSCTATAQGRSVEVDQEQAENAALIAGIAVRRDLPARAATIALATAYQESDIRNLDHGDRDSLGVFQQRPSQGWGTPQQIQNPRYAARQFYDELVRVEGYRSMEITDAAQEVQRSAFGEAYAYHERDARILASALTGYSQHAFTCTVGGLADELASRVSGDDTQPRAQEIGRNGLTPRADAVRRDLRRTFGPLVLGGFAPGGITSGHIEGSAHYDGRAIDIFFRPVDEANQREGWAVAHYLVARAELLGVQTVIYDDRIWTAARSGSGWRNYDAPEGANQAVLEHRDHVHVDVVEGG